MDVLDVVEIPGFFSNKINRKVICYQNGVAIQQPRSKQFIAAENIKAFRCGVEFVSGYAFTIGRQYVFEIKDVNSHIYKIKLKSFYGRRKEEYRLLINDINNKLWSNYFVNILNDYIDLFNARQPFELLGVKFADGCISWEKSIKLSGNEIAISSFKTYFVVHPVNDPKQYISFNFLNDWNAFILQSFLKAIINHYKSK